MAGRAANGEGSLYQRRSDGRWVGAVLLGYDSTGRALRKTVSAKSRADAVKKLRTSNRISITDCQPLMTGSPLLV